MASVGAWMNIELMVKISRVLRGSISVLFLLRTSSVSVEVLPSLFHRGLSVFVPEQVHQYEHHPILVNLLRKTSMGRCSPGFLFTPSPPPPPQLQLLRLGFLYLDL